MTENKENKDNLTKEIVLSVAFIILPVLLSFTELLINRITSGQFAFPGIKWNDEAAYYKLVELYSEYLTPQGYWGFNSEHAIWGTGSAWNFAIIAPYALIARILPINYSFVYFCNLGFAGLANGLFLLLVKPDFKVKIKLIAAQATSIVFLLYLNTNMSEIFRFALVTLIAGLLYKVIFDDACPIWIKYIITPIVLLYSMQVYTFFAFAVPVYMLAVIKKGKVWLRVLIALAVTAVTGGGSYVLLHFISSNYNIGKTEKLLGFLKSGQIFAAAKSFLGMMLDGLRGLLDLRYYVYSNPMYIFHVFFAALLVIMGIRLLSDGKASKKDRIIGLIVTYSVVIFFLMYMTLYTIVPDTFVRGTEIVILFSLMLLMTTEEKYLALSLIVCNAVGLLFFPKNLSSFAEEERYYSEETVSEWQNLEYRFYDIFHEPYEGMERGAWDYTVLMYSMEPRLICAIPDKMGINFALKNEYFGDGPMYVVFTKHRDLRGDYVEHNVYEFLSKYGEEFNESYFNLYEDEEYVVFERITYK